MNADIVNVALVGIYILGVVLIPVVSGIVMRSEDISGSDFLWDFCVPISLMSLMWPFVLVMAGVIAAMIGAAMLPGFAFKSLMKIGQLIGNIGKRKKRIDRWEDEDEERQQALS